MSLIERWECDDCGKPASENGHEHLTTDGYVTMPVTLKRYVPADQLAGAVGEIKWLRGALSTIADGRTRDVQRFARLTLDADPVTYGGSKQ
jgi:hypothetical protein